MISKFWEIKFRHETSSKTSRQLSVLGYYLPKFKMMWNLFFPLKYIWNWKQRVSCRLNDGRGRTGFTLFLLPMSPVKDAMTDDKWSHYVSHSIPSPTKFNPPPVSSFLSPTDRYTVILLSSTFHSRTDRYIVMLLLHLHIIHKHPDYHSLFFLLQL